MTKAEQNEFTRQAVKEQVLSNPAYAGTRKLILILMCIPSAFFVADRILAWAEAKAASLPPRTPDPAPRDL